MKQGETAHKLQIAKLLKIFLGYIYIYVYIKNYIYILLACLYINKYSVIYYIINIFLKLYIYI